MRRKIIKKFRASASKACRKLNIYDTTKRTWISFFNLRILAYSLRIYALRYHDNNLDASYPSSRLLQKETSLYRGLIEPASYYQLRISEKKRTVRLSNTPLHLRRASDDTCVAPSVANGVLIFRTQFATQRIRASLLVSHSVLSYQRNIEGVDTGNSQSVFCGTSVPL